MSQTYHCRPSELINLGDPVASYYLDRSVMVFGVGLDNALEKAVQQPNSSKKPLTEAARENARAKVFGEWLNIEVRRFRDPAVR